MLRHGGAHGLFGDLAPVGAKEGCFLSDCTNTDKFICPSAAECATACAQVGGCEFWTFEYAISKCFLRRSDAGREAAPGFVSGSRSCLPADRAGDAGAAHLAVPFAKAALWAAGLPALRPCDGGVGSPGCDNPYLAMGVWRYATNNLRLAVRGLPEAEVQRHKSTLGYIRQIGADIAGFYRSPTAESFQTAVSNCRAVFEALAGWLSAAPPTQLAFPLGGAPAPASKLAGLAAADASGDIRQAAVALADGRQMPLVGFGTWQLLGQEVYDATLAALRSGYRHIDTAQAYMNEREIGLAIRDSGVRREDIFIATKISDPSEYPALEQRLAQQLEALGTDYLDLYMLHGPSDKAGQEAAWRTLEALHDRGVVRSLGVSNFGPRELEEMLGVARVKPVYVQNKLSVYTPGEHANGDVSMLAFARERGICLMGYSVINPWPGMLPPMEDPHVRAVADRYGRSPAQVLHRWALQLGAAVIPRSSSASRIAENARLFDFQLSDLDVRLLNGIATLGDSTVDRVAPPWAPDVYRVGALDF